MNRFTRFATEPAHVGGHASDRFHVGGGRADVLGRDVTAAQRVNEPAESLEQLRALSLGMRIEVGIIDTIPLGVDTPEDLQKARAILGEKKA